jgi:ethanolamine utilization protein EutN
MKCQGTTLVVPNMRIKNARALAPEQSVVDEKMFLARIEGTVVATAKHPSLEGCRFLVARRLEADGSAAAEPNVVVDWMGAARGETVMVSTDGDIAREKLGNNTPARMVVVGLVDAVQQPVQAEGAA